MKVIVDKSGLIDAVRGIATFRFLEEAEAIDLLEHSEALAFGEGEVVVEEGEVSPYFYGIAEGTVAVSLGEEGKEVYVNSLGAGEVFGEAGLFMSVSRTATVRAQGSTVILRIHRSVLAGFLKRHPVAGNKMLIVFIYGLLRKLRLADQELAYERKSDASQEDVDAMVANIFGEKD
jgi:CRP/FNR family transcriptional regulator, cyclic AMP receptor protein